MLLPKNGMSTGLNVVNMSDEKDLETGGSKYDKGAATVDNVNQEPDKTGVKPLHT